MSYKSIRHFLPGALILLGLLIGGCAAPAAEISPSNSTEPAVKLRIAVLPVLDTLPIYIAEKEGLFTAKNLEVELIPVASAPERDQLIAAGQADGMVNEALSTAFFNKDQISAQVIRYARAATSSNALFSILASAQNDIDTLEELKGVEIGISQGTVIEYLTDRLLQAQGFSPADIRTIAVPKIDERMNLLGTGSLKAAMLPEPLTTLATINGAKVILDDTSHPEYSFSVITFRKQTIDEKPEAVRAFLAAIEEAVELINTNPEQYGNLMVEKKVVPPMLEGKFKVPAFVTAGVPTQAQWEDMINWAVEKGLLKQPVPYSSSVNSQFLPK